MDGRTLAGTAAVTLDTDTITRPTTGAPQAAATTALTSSANPALANQPVTFTAAAEPS